ncbi:MAG: hypothetical protein LBL59_05725 [Xanthomonadaceae bacterium]|nr:hypothetical protein [Xanthomonadaceae bacterium]
MNNNDAKPARPSLFKADAGPVSSNQPSPCILESAGPGVTGKGAAPAALPITRKYVWIPLASLVILTVAIAATCLLFDGRRQRVSESRIASTVPAAPARPTEPLLEATQDTGERLATAAAVLLPTERAPSTGDPLAMLEAGRNRASPTVPVVPAVRGDTAPLATLTQPRPPTDRAASVPASTPSAGTVTAAPTCAPSIITTPVPSSAQDEGSELMRILLGHIKGEVPPAAGGQ